MCPVYRTPLTDKALCHCADCRKISGGNYSNNFLVPSENFKVVEGTPKKISKIADTGKEITSNFCGDCGTTLFRYGDTFGGIDGMRVIKAGILDDVEIINNTKPGAELFAPERIAWVSQVAGEEGQVIQTRANTWTALLTTE